MKSKVLFSVLFQNDRHLKLKYFLFQDALFSIVSFGGDINFYLLLSTYFSIYNLLFYLFCLCIYGQLVFHDIIFVNSCKIFQTWISVTVNLKLWFNILILAHVFLYEMHI